MVECSPGAHRSPIGVGCLARRFRGANAVFQDWATLWRSIHVFTCWRGYSWPRRSNDWTPGEWYARRRVRDLRSQWDPRCDIWEQTKRFPCSAAESQRGRRIRKQRDFPGGWYLSANLKGPRSFEVKARSGGQIGRVWFCVRVGKVKGWGRTFFHVCVVSFLFSSRPLFENACS